MAIRYLLDLVSYEHENISIVKYFLKIVGFAKNLVNPIDQEINDLYVTTVRKFIALNNIRNSTKCATSLTMAQLNTFQPEFL